MQNDVKFAKTTSSQRNIRCVSLQSIFTMLKAQFGADISGDANDIEVVDITSDSRNSAPKKLFVAIKGVNGNGHDFINDAIKRGAEAIIAQRNEKIPKIDIPLALVPDTREALVSLLKIFLGEPPEKLFATTGTNGKTTVTHILWQILTELGERAGLIGTLGYSFEDGVHKKIPITTPDAESLWRLLAEMRRRNISAVAMEASSHGIHQKRLWGLQFKTAIFTNLTQDHLDYHGDMKRYLEAKCQLFETLSKSSFAVVNIDDPHSESIISANNGELVTYAIENRNADILAEPKRMDINGSHFGIKTPWGTFDVRTHLPGRFNIYNASAAAGAAMTQGYNPEDVIKAIAKVKYIKGRFHRIVLGQNFAVIIDYAHTPDALRNLIITAKELVAGRIIIVFGAGGDRDKNKRPIMGKIATALADIAIITSDNPRSEDPMEIIKMIENGVESKSKYKIIANRREAIFEAIGIANDGDAVLIAGKGHEDYQIIGDRVIHFDDAEVAEEALRQKLRTNHKG